MFHSVHLLQFRLGSNFRGQYSCEAIVFVTVNLILGSSGSQECFLAR